ncbi:hypothetical protein PACTADRAFT_185870 [Pachysolen tannophilus NRRL Y-2460]|uniref:Metacaspase-1 n=1 Tax=Pachysolen tannophilus NRRL Y-2460 TaxID=669874 RepID=A0A1E4U1E8_PACTA|nr:hypothetical protein PACTADRAFT_185870 [Pachysolen tannophilus NRRL Y-2460]
MYPGQINHNYRKYPGGQAYDQQQAQQQQYARPAGPPPQQQYQYQSYSRPPAPPPPQYVQEQQYRPPPGRPISAQAQQQHYGEPNHFASNGIDASRTQFQRPPGAPPKPSSAPQSFGQNSNMTFQYSNCTGKKKALLIGINYFGTSNELKGCINDVRNMSSFLINNYGYKIEDMVILTDDQRNPISIPTRANIIRAMHWLVNGAQPNDSLFFHYSGHGGTTKDLDGDEESGYDDTIYPVDFKTAGMIIDDEMHDIMVRPLAPGIRLTALYDSCHSGTALDLPYVYSTKGIVKEPNLWKDAGSGAMSAAMNYANGNITGVFSSVSDVFNKFTNSNSNATEVTRQRKFSPADVISISGCKDSQTSADSAVNGMATGAMSWSFITTLSQQPQQSYLTLLNNMRNLMVGKYTQKPQLSSSHPIDMNLQFVM